ncbi:MAG: CRTAC1 family protein [Verrucomicrobiales bacterium]|nr:CRTAC1 family protein [Verrucomicrobiales bacterium]
MSLAIFLSACGRSPRLADEAETSSSAGLPADSWFEEVAALAGVDFRHSSGHTHRFYMPEMMTGGVGLLDYDGDGFLDIFCVNGGSLDPSVTNKPGSKLYRNLGNWRFEDMTARGGVGGQGAYGMGCACGDYNQDGHVDLYVSHLHGGILYRNNGDGTFTDTTREAGIDGQSWGTSAAFLDYDNDGNLDLVVANYIKWSPETELNCYSRGGLPDYCSPLNYKAPAMATLYHNQGNGVFQNVTLAAGLDQAYGNGLGVACADFNRDGRIDMYVANDAMPNQLWLNKGNGKFVDEALFRGCAVNSQGVPRAGMGVAAADIRQCGWLDLFITHLVGEGNGWFVNTNGTFTDRISPRGPTAPSTSLTGFGVGFADFDHDGNLDLYVANGRVKYGARDLDPTNPYAEPNTLLRGLGQGDFEEVQPPGGTAQLLLTTSRGVALGDLDNDGSIDAVVVNKDGPVHLLRNVVKKRGSWIMFRVLNRKGLDAINASVRIEANGRAQFREVMPNQGYCSSQDPRVHFGLGSVREKENIRVAVRWPGGREEGFGPFEAGHLHTIQEGIGTSP